MHAFILGAGPTGLITAWKLLQNNYRVTIIEKDNQVGGLCRSWNYKDYIIDVGPHIFHTPEKELSNFWEKEFKNLFLKGKFYSKNVKGNNFENFYDYPLSISSIKKQFPKILKDKIFSELERRDLKKASKAVNYREYVDSFIGKTLRQMFFEKYPEKIWGISTKKMTSEWAPNRIKFRKKNAPFYSDEWAAVGKYGTGSIYEKIKDNIIKLGGEFKFNENVTGFKKNNLIIKEINTSKQNYQCSDSLIISSLPLPITSKFLGKKSNLKFRGICSVFLFYNLKSILPKNTHWLYFDSEKLLFNRITENKKLSKYVCPKDKTFLTAEITYSLGDKFSKMSKNDVKKLVAKQIDDTNLAKEKYIDEIKINYEPFVYPVQYAKYKNELKQTKSFVERHKNIFSIGAGGDFNYADSQVLFHKSFDLVDMIVTNNKLYNVRKDFNSIDLNREITINNKKIGPNNKCFIIAEAGINHNGNFDIAKKLILEAKKSGCDAIKFQSFLPESRVSKKVKSERYVEKVIDTEESINQLFTKVALKFDEQKKLFNFAKKHKILMFSTPFDFESANFLDELGVDVFKIASMDLANIPLVEHVAKKMKPVIISTGMSKLYEIDETVEAFKGTGNPNLIILHCNSSYPSSNEELNLKLIKNYKKIYPCPIGYSDHSENLLSSIISLSMGASVIERHFTLDKNMDGPDHILSSTPTEMQKLVNYSYEIPQILGDGYKKIQPNEYDTLNAQKKSIYAKIKIKKGQKFSKKNLIIKGPAGGLPSKFYDLIINKKSKFDIDPDLPIKWEYI